MNLYKVFINWEVTGHILVAAKSEADAEKKAGAYVDADAFKVEGVLEPEHVSGTGIVLEGSTDVVTEVIS